MPTLTTTNTNQEGAKTIVDTETVTTTSEGVIKTRTLTESTVFSAITPPWDITIIITTGQSQAAGERSQPVISTSQPYLNLKLTDTLYSSSTSDSGGDLSIAPLTAPIRPIPVNGNLAYEWPNNIIGETPDVGLANQLSETAGWVVAAVNVAETGHGIDHIKKGGSGQAYAKSIYEVQQIFDLAQAQDKTCGVGYLFLDHGGTDYAQTDYAAQAEQLRADYDADCKEITGQERDIIGVFSPPSTAYNFDYIAYPSLAIKELTETYPEHWCYGGSVYQYPYFPETLSGISVTNGFHMEAPGSRRVGEKAAQALLRHCAGLPHCLRPVSVQVSGNVARIKCEVPAGPLQFSNTLPAPHHGFTEWANGKGIEVLKPNFDKNTITSVELDGSDVVVICDSSIVSGSIIMNAMWQDENGYGGEQSYGRRSLICDSEPFVSYSAPSIECNLTNNSSEISCVNSGGFYDRGRKELVSGLGLPEEVYVVSIDGDEITLSEPWNGETGTASLFFKNDHRNYLIQFKIAV